MDCQVNEIGKVIRPLFADPITIIIHVAMQNMKENMIFMHA